MLKKIGAFLTNPHRLFYSARARVDRSGLNRRYRQLAQQEGFRDLFLVLSFDCDTREDAEAALQVHDRLKGLGVPAVYAVPGDLLRKSADVYRRIADAGGEFINHGYHDHTYFDRALGRYASQFFYDRLPLETVRNDIIKATAIFATRWVLRRKASARRISAPSRSPRSFASSTVFSKTSATHSPPQPCRSTPTGSVRPSAISVSWSCRCPAWVLCRFEFLTAGPVLRLQDVVSDRRIMHAKAASPATLSGRLASAC